MKVFISKDRFKRSPRSDSMGKAKKVQINIMVDPVRKAALDILNERRTAELRQLREPKFPAVNYSADANDRYDRDPELRAIERQLNKQARENKHGGRGQDITIDV